MVDHNSIGDKYQGDSVSIGQSNLAPSVHRSYIKKEKVNKFVRKSSGMSFGLKYKFIVTS